MPLCQNNLTTIQRSTNRVHQNPWQEQLLTRWSDWADTRIFFYFFKHNNSSVTTWQRPRAVNLARVVNKPSLIGIPVCHCWVKRYWWDKIHEASLQYVTLSRRCPDMSYCTSPGLWPLRCPSESDPFLWPLHTVYIFCNLFILQSSRLF